MSELADLTKRVYEVEQTLVKIDRGMGQFVRYVNGELAKLQTAVEAIGGLVAESESKQGLILPPGVSADG